MDIISSEQLRKLKKIKPFGHSAASKKKIRQILLIFPVLGKMTHICTLPKGGMYWVPMHDDQEIFQGPKEGRKKS